MKHFRLNIFFIAKFDIECNVIICQKIKYRHIYTRAIAIRLVGAFLKINIGYVDKNKRFLNCAVVGILTKYMTKGLLYHFSGLI